MSIAALLGGYTTCVLRKLCTKRAQLYMYLYYLLLFSDTYLSKLPTDSEKLLQCSTLVSETTPPKSIPVHCDIPVCIVLYVVMRGKERRRGRGKGGRIEREIDESVSDEVLEVMKVFSTIMANEDIPIDTRNRLVIQVG